MFTLNDRTRYLKSLLTAQVRQPIADSPLEIDFLDFVQQKTDVVLENCQHSFSALFGAAPDSTIVENKQFLYPIFRYRGTRKDSSAILLLHGLNERSWEKYLCWAEYLALHTQKPVLMFPIAFHMNRTPESWYNPRSIMKWLIERRNEIKDAENLTVANLALSDRLTCTPLRFYTSGKETAYNIWQLCSDIRLGNHPYFTEGTTVDFFAYSIGALLAQVLLMSNPEQLFSDSLLFMFCGGSLFNRMNGNSRYIMDKPAFDTMVEYYQQHFLNVPADGQDCFETAFRSMIDANVDRSFREQFFTNASARIRAVSLKKDGVMPTQGIRMALGEKCATRCLTEMDFPFMYSHEMPFPIHMSCGVDIDQMFTRVFSLATAFLR